MTRHYYCEGLGQLINTRPITIGSVTDKRVSILSGIESKIPANSYWQWHFFSTIVNKFQIICHIKQLIGKKNRENLETTIREFVHKTNDSLLLHIATLLLGPVFSLQLILTSGNPFFAIPLTIIHSSIFPVTS